MDHFFFLLFALLCSWTLIKIIIKPRLAYEYPFFMGCMFTIFLLPQAVGMLLNPRLAPPGSVGPTFLMCFLCLLMAVLGYYYAPAINVSKRFNHDLNLKKLLAVALGFT